jgi:hypothetical protein
MLEQKFCSRTRVSSSETAYDPRVIKRPAAGCWRCWAFGVKPASRFQRSFHRSAESRPVGGRAFERDGCRDQLQRPWRIGFLRMRSFKSELRTRWPSPRAPLHRRESDISKRHDTNFPAAHRGGKASHCPLSDWWNWDVPGGTNCSHLQDHFAVLGPCIMRRSRGFGI